MALKLKYYKTHPEALTPVYSTTDAACFDISLCTYGKMGFKGYDESGKEFTRLLTTDGGVLLCPKDRVLAPTGLIFDIPKEYSIRIHPRSGLSLKEGLTLANAQGVIDSDYMEETFVMLTNLSSRNITISNLSRICQGELVKNNRVSFEEIKERPTRENTNRKGGFGSTGTKALDNPSANTI
jgi:dUTP pyrophosphatase